MRPGLGAGGAGSKDGAEGVGEVGIPEGVAELPARAGRTLWPLVTTWPPRPAPVSRSASGGPRGTKGRQRTWPGPWRTRRCGPG